MKLEPIAPNLHNLFSIMLKPTLFYGLFLDVMGKLSPAPFHWRELALKSHF